MGLFDAIDISGSGLTAERLRMDTIANNLANANTTRTPGGGPFVRQVVVLGEKTSAAVATGNESFASFGGMQAGQSGTGVQAVGIENDKTPGKKVYDPGNPDADRKGYVTMPNVNPVTEMVDLITATRGYEADTSAVKAAEGMANHALDVIR
jgi:flagellar basal-body rod protein FlgC